jgi:branched-chain amino acid aminotransferase
MRACYLRPVVVRTGEQMGFYPIGVPVETFIIAYNWGAYLGHDALASGVDVSVSSWRRAAPDTFPTLAKAGGNYLNSQLSKTQAKLDGYAEGIMLDSFGFVAEGSGENLFLIRDEVLYTSPVAAGILHGITRDSVIQIARDLGVEVREQNIPREMLYIADELPSQAQRLSLRRSVRSIGSRSEKGSGVRPRRRFRSASCPLPKAESPTRTAG